MISPTDLSASGGHDSIISIVWDDIAQAEQHRELKARLEPIEGVGCAVLILMKMKP